MLASAQSNAASYLPSNYEDTLRAGYDQQLASIIAELGDSTIPAFENLNNNAGGLDVSLMRPLSRGTCHINSNDPFASPSVDPRWLIHPFDYDVMVSAMAFNQKILDTPAIQALQPTYLDVPRDADADTLGNILRVEVGTEYHYSGTAAMLPRNLGGVVDNNLLVYGTDNLRVVDTSIHPMVPGAHLQAVAYAVAEKAADIIKGVSSAPA
jgi:choline dehydrogenase